MSNSNSQNPDSLETADSLAKKEKLPTSDHAATVVEMSGDHRTPKESPIEPGETERSESSRQDANETLRSSPSLTNPGRKLVLVLLALLLISVAINLMQAQQQRRAAVQSAEIDLALDHAMQRIDEETIRGNRAEGTLTKIDRNVDNVQERIAELQAALLQLSEATAR